uniref:MHC class II beta chain N-terminal domain-containing protein n=1 Tax=Castor canadensis TaxID=51338 RepID=A0A8C0WPR4_CASCN
MYSIFCILSPPFLFSNNFYLYLKSECHFSHRMEWVQFLERHIYNREENLLFDSDLGHYRAVTELGQPDAKYWNSQKDFLEPAAEWRLDLPDPGDVGNSSSEWRGLHLPGGAPNPEEPCCSGVDASVSAISLAFWAEVPGGSGALQIMFPPWSTTAVPALRTPSKTKLLPSVYHTSSLLVRVESWRSGHTWVISAIIS